MIERVDGLLSTTAGFASIKFPFMVLRPLIAGIREYLSASCTPWGEIESSRVLQRHA